MRFGIRLFGLCAILSMACGCATVVPPNLQKEVTPGLSLDSVREKPEDFKGKTVLWGGRIIKTVNKKRGTLIEVLQLDLDSQDRPKDEDVSHGRFIVSMTGYLDPAIYHQGRDITVVGRVVRVEDLPLGEIAYRYVLLKGEEVHLWKKKSEAIRVYHDLPPAWMYRAAPYPYWYTAPYPWW